MEESLNIDAIVARYREVPGATLVGWQNVALPIFVLKIRIVLIDRQPISLIDEFILKAIGNGVNNNLDLGKFLGLDFKTVDDHLAELHRGELITATGTSHDTSVSVGLTPRGKLTCSELSKKVTEEQEIKVRVHGISRQPIPFRGTDLLSDRDCEENEIPMIPPVPATRPSLGELSVDSIAAVLKPYWKKQGRSAELIAIKGVARDGKLKFEPALMLEYRAGGAKTQSQYSFVVNGERKADYDEQFAKRGGAKKVSSLISFNSALTDRDITRAFLNPAISPPEDEVDRAIEFDAMLQKIGEKIHAAKNEPLSTAKDPDTKQRLTARIAELETELLNVKALQSTLSVTVLRTNDCFKAIRKAIAEAQRRLIIVSGTLSMYALDFLLPELETAVRDRGIELWIGYGMNKDTNQGMKHRAKSGFDDCIKELDSLRKRWKDKVKLQDWGNSHSKILLCDEQYAIVGSYNWLSHKPVGMKVMKEHAVKVTFADTISALLKECEGQFQS